MDDALATMNVCILPPPEISSLVVGLAESLDDSDLLFSVDGRTRLPHLTVLMHRIKPDLIPQYITSIRSISALTPFECVAYGLTLSANGYVEIGFNRSGALEKLQRSVYEAVSDLWFTGIDADDSSLSTLERANERKYGYKLFGDLYRPHITLGAYGRKQSDLELPYLSEFSRFNFHANKVTIAESDSYGAVVKILGRDELT